MFLRHQKATSKSLEKRAKQQNVSLNDNTWRMRKKRDVTEEKSVRSCQVSGQMLHEIHAQHQQHLEQFRGIHIKRHTHTHTHNILLFMVIVRATSYLFLYMDLECKIYFWNLKLKFQYIIVCLIMVTFFFKNVRFLTFQLILLINILKWRGTKKHAECPGSADVCLYRCCSEVCFYRAGFLRTHSWHAVGQFVTQLVQFLQMSFPSNPAPVNTVFTSRRCCPRCTSAALEIKLQHKDDGE